MIKFTSGSPEDLCASLEALLSQNLRHHCRKQRHIQRASQVLDSVREMLRNFAIMLIFARCISCCKVSGALPAPSPAVS
jgi:hypothetical protein